MDTQQTPHRSEETESEGSADGRSLVHLKGSFETEISRFATNTRTQRGAAPLLESDVRILILIEKAS